MGGDGTGAAMLEINSLGLEERRLVMPSRSKEFVDMLLFWRLLR